MVLFKKPNRKFRQRVTHSDSDEGSGEETAEKKEKKPKEQKAESKEKPKPLDAAGTSRQGASKSEKSDNQPPTVPPTKLLSFHDEEDDGEVFKLKKSNYSRRLAKKLEKERRKKLQESGTSAEDSREFGQSSTSNTAQQADPKKSSSDILSGKDAEDMDVDDDDGNSQDAAKENPFKDVLQRGIIPDAATIYAMKKHRQLAREMGDFIPLEDAERDEETKSRLVRDDDNDRSDDDDDEPSRLSFTVNTGALERQKVREAFLSLQEGSTNELENEDAAELEMWEREQIRKGVSIVQSGIPQSHPSQEGSYYPFTSSAESKMYYETVPVSTIVPKTLSGVPPIPLQSSSKSELTTASIKARLEQRLTTLKEIHNGHKYELEKCKKEIRDANELIEKIEREAPELAKRYSLYQQLRGYVRDLVECLDLKVAHIDLIDTRLMDLYQERADRLVARRQQDVRDQSDECSLLCARYMKGGVVDVMGDKNGLQDESKLRRAAEREGRRMRRRKKRERSLLPPKHHDGMSSDDEEPDSDILKFKEQRDALLLECEDVFEDVVEEFGTLQGVMSNFQRWKQDQIESYTEAFVPLCLPKIFGPFARLELLSWNPLEDDLNIEAMNWYQTLVLYGLVNEKHTEDPDVSLLPAIVEKVILPKVSGFVKKVWDPVSFKQTSRLVNLVRKLYDNYPTISGKSKQFQGLLQAVCVRMNKSIADDVFIPWYPGDLLENRSLASSIFFQRQFWMTVKFFTNIVMWDGIIAEQPLQEMALSSVLNRYLIMGLNTSMVMKDTLEKCKTIAASFPKSWFSGVKGCKTLSLLQQFSQYLVKYGMSFSKAAVKQSHLEEDDIREIVKEIIQLLIGMNALEDAVVLAKEFSISGFKKDGGL